MDTKLKNTSWDTRRILCIAFVILFVVTASIMVMTAIQLTRAYEIEGGSITASDSSEYFVGELSNKESFHSELRDYMRTMWRIEVVSGFTAFIAMIMAFVTVGKKDADGAVRMSWFDRWFTEIQLVLSGCAVGGAIGLGMVYYEMIPMIQGQYSRLANLALDGAKDFHQTWSGNYSDSYIPTDSIAIICILGLAVCFGVLLLCMNSIIKKIKGKVFWKNTLLGALIIALWNAFKENDDVTVKVMGLCLAACILSASWIGFIPVIILILIFVPKWLKKYRKIKTGIRELKKGNLEYKIEVDDNGELDRLAADVNEITKATKIAVENENKSSRMKTDLISNVSHDIKTPLTSMITYVDLLKVEGLDSPKAPEYLKIVDEKTQRLKKLTEDLFEAAKASSGAIPVDMQRIEMVSLINQALAETEEKFEKRNLQVIFSNKAESLYVMADGQLLWRVMENIFVNASKYALEGSRVYVDILEKDKYLTVEVKNMSEAQLNITADELMERFQRGDDSRNTEGSGLGLSIAKDLTELMNGKFEINIDGDLFKASVTLEKNEEIA